MKIAAVSEYIRYIQRREKTTEERIQESKMYLEKLLEQRIVNERIQRARRMHSDKGQFVDHYC